MGESPFDGRGLLLEEAGVYHGMPNNLGEEGASGVPIPDIFILGDHSTLSDANIGLQSITCCITYVGLCFWCCTKKGKIC